ncbi:MAG: hypothetical protein AAGG53_10940, partial [Cyanobacteria bacterium P01_H01_bin.152]
RAVVVTTIAPLANLFTSKSPTAAEGSQVAHLGKRFVERSRPRTFNLEYRFSKIQLPIFPFRPLAPIALY